MSKLKELLDSQNILEEILSMTDEKLFSYFKELSNLDFHLNDHGMPSKHRFKVIDHTKKLLKNFSLALKYRNNPIFMEQELVGGTLFKKDFYKRIIHLIDKLNLVPHMDDFKIITLVLLLHDVGKGSYDVSDSEIIEESMESSKRGRRLSTDYLKLLYKTKDHEERGAFLVYSLLEEVDGVDQSFANRVKNLILCHGDLSKLQFEKDFNFNAYLRRIMENTTAYNYPFINQPNPNELLIHELDLNYLIFLFDIYSVDDEGRVWYSVKQQKETIYLKARWLLGQKLEDLLVIVRESFPQWDDEKFLQIQKLLRKNFLKGFRTRSSFLLETEITGICTSVDKRKLLSLINDYFSHTDVMYPLYLNHTSPKEKLLHINLLNNSNGDFKFHINAKKDLLEVIIVKSYAPEGTLLRIVKSLINSSIECNRILKIYEVHAYSGEDNRLVDKIIIKHHNSEEIPDCAIDTITNHLQNCNHPNFYIGKLELPITQEELDYRVQVLQIELNEVEVGARKFQELKIEYPKLSNLLLYSCLVALNYINIIDVKVEEVESRYIYSFLLSRRQNHTITSPSSFKRDIIEQLTQNVLVNQ